MTHINESLLSAVQSVISHFCLFFSIFNNSIYSILFKKKSDKHFNYTHFQN